jgi:hypothetical protein
MNLPSWQTKVDSFADGGGGGHVAISIFTTAAEKFGPLVIYHWQFLPLETKLSLSEGKVL